MNFSFQNKETETGSPDTKKCHACLSDIPEKATKCSHCSTKQRAKFKKRHLVVLFIFFLVFMGILLGSGDSSTPQDTGITDNQAHIMAQGFVSSVLKSPSTADYPMYDFTVRDLENDTYQVISYVDSENSFGAEIRSNYIATIQYIGDEWANPNSWTLQELIIDGEVLYPSN